MSETGRGTYGSLRSGTPRPLRRPLYSAIEHVGAWTGWARSLPSFIIVGGQRCGTNSLYEYLVAHPRIGRALPIQEVHYFDLHFDKGLRWYRGHFPIRMGGSHNAERSGPRPMTGECSPYYMFHPLAPRRIADTLSGVKMFVLLRNPIDRAYSHFQHECARGVETLSFEDAISREEDRLAGEVGRMCSDPGYQSFNHQHFSYLARGRYIEQLETLFSLFPREQIQVLPSERLFSDPAGAHSAALRFLGVPPQSLAGYARHNPGRYTDMDPKLRKRLFDYFAESNDRLYRILDSDFRWE